ncbi:MAG: PhzF family phenazine biosynthesis protein [Lawsonibacter sp.]|nr:PhzF family phenazine biosynthesis protein [Lawsonibacter sp.]
MRQYVVDAFAGHVFEGNPAAVIVTERPMGEELMASITRENNLSETAFACPEGDGWRLRWFTPGGEIDLCGHATLAAAYVIDRFVRPGGDGIRFETLSGTLAVGRRGELYEMDFPAYTLKPLEVTEQITDALGIRPKEVWRARDLLCVFDRAEDVVNMKPDMEKLKGLKGALMQVTAPGSGEFDCVSRSFAPKMGVPEDPVCGSGHCHIIPYWAARTGRTEFTARQASRRGGTLYCRLEGSRVKLAGKAVLYARSELMLEGVR